MTQKINDTNIQEYLNSLPDNIKELTLNRLRLTYLPDLSRFKQLIHLYCNDNNLAYLPQLPLKLTKLECRFNKLTYLPKLPEKLCYLDCEFNQLTTLPTLPQKLTKLYCSHNKLTSLTKLPHNLRVLHCDCNKLTYLPLELPKLAELHCQQNKLYFIPKIPTTIQKYQFYCFGNPISDIIDKVDYNIGRLKSQTQNIDTLNRFRKNYYAIQYALKFKKQFRDWLWIRVREPKIRLKYHPKHLAALQENDDLDEFLHNW